MSVLALLAGAFSLYQAVTAIQHQADSFDAAGEKVLIVDVRGPTRSTGDGVRVMGMLMDLQACGYHVEVLSDAANSSELRQSWPHDVAMERFSGVRLWQASGGGLPAGLQLKTFARFIIGAKLDLLYEDGRQGHAVPSVLSALSDNDDTRKKVVAFWDDVPFERCQMKPEADTICPRVPATVKKFAKYAHKFYVLSVDDKTRMTNDMKAHGIPMDKLGVYVWPMRISNMQKVVPYTPFTPNTQTRNLVVMMGNLHAVNRFMVTEMFESGALEKICSEIATRGKNVKIAFLGGLADVAKEQMDLRPQASSCLDVRTGYMSDTELEENIYPRTRAVLNPFFEDVNSGISVKNFESIMSGVPFLTSAYGMHGLSDEVDACASFPMPSKPGDPTAFAQFFINNVVDNAGYLKFADAFAKHAPACIEGQLKQYPIHNLC